MSSATAAWYLRYADDEAHGQSPTYEDWARGVAGDEELLALLDELPEQKRQPALVFSCARLLGAKAGPWSDFRAWLIGHWDAAATEVLRRTTQTNEPRRCTALLPALALIPGPLALIEVGASAGLTLIPDRYSYRYEEHRLGNGPLVLECEPLTPVPLPGALPDIGWRRGIDLAPLDVRHTEDVRWLEALVPPEQTARRDRVRLAVEVARVDPPVIVAGDAVDGLAEVVAQVPAGLTPVVMSAGTLVYLPGRRRQQFRELVRELHCRWVAMERIGVFPDLTPRDLPQVPGTSPALVTLDETPLAVAGPHGQHLSWLRS